MKTFRLIGAGLLAIVLCFTFSSCDPDDDGDEDGGGNNPFVGVWDAWIGWGHDNVFEFKSNGRFVLVCHWDNPTYGNGHSCNEETRPEEYSYNPDTKEFLLMYDEGYTDSWIVSHIGQNKIVFRAGNSTYTFTRIE